MPIKAPKSTCPDFHPAHPWGAVSLLNRIALRAWHRNRHDLNVDRGLARNGRIAGFFHLHCIGSALIDGNFRDHPKTGATVIRFHSQRHGQLLSDGFSVGGMNRHFEVRLHGAGLTIPFHHQNHMKGHVQGHSRWRLNLHVVENAEGTERIGVHIDRRAVGEDEVFNDHDSFIKAQGFWHHHLDLHPELGEDGGMFDPSKLNPQAISEITDLMRTLTPAQMMKLQSIMHNQMAGFNVAQEMMEFEQSMPPDFKAKMARIMYMANGIEVPAAAGSAPAVEEPKNENEARLVILQSVAAGMMKPEEALKVLFP